VSPRRGVARPVAVGGRRPTDRVYDSDSARDRRAVSEPERRSIRMVMKMMMLPFFRDSEPAFKLRRVCETDPIPARYPS
jgi:hypothetical protein